MKSWILVIALTVLSGVARAGDQYVENEKQCADEVKAFLLGVQALRDVGSEKKPFGLAAEEVETIQSENGTCAAARLIKARMWEASK